jgi:hypothetical protein
MIEGLPEAAQLDYQDKKAVKLFMIELLSFSSILVNKFEDEWKNLIDLLKNAGYSKKELDFLISQASEQTIYEKYIPRVIKN